MLGEKGARIGRGNKRAAANRRVDAFLAAMRTRGGKIVNLDFPKDRKRADGGVRKSNIAKASRACTQLISVRRC